MKILTIPSKPSRIPFFHKGPRPVFGLAAGLMLALGAWRAAAQAPFTNQPVLGFPQSNLDVGTAAWGDYDNDGKLDLLLSGTTNVPAVQGLAQLWHNDGNGNFHLVAIPVPILTTTPGPAVWVDYDNDGYLDFMIEDQNGLELYHNQHDGTFTNVPLPGITVGGSPSAAGWAVPWFSWCDYDHDGRPDLAIVSLTGDVQVWHNDGGGSFSQVPISLTTGYTVQWADMDNDGWVDLVVTGTPAGPPDPVQIFHNNFTNNVYPLFTLVATIPPLNSSPRSLIAATADYNNDGLLDFAACGGDFGGSSGYSLWLNLGGDQFTNQAVIPASFAYRNMLAAGDYDNDGLPDIVEFNPSFVGLLHNDGGGNFSTNALAFPLTGTNAGVIVSFADYDNDGRLDLFTASMATPPQLWHNQTPLANTPPTAPNGLVAVPFTNGVQLSWNPATDAQTPSAGLSYNLRVGTVPGTDDYMAASADLVTGWRRIVQRGAIQGTHYTLTQMPPGIYYWSVQAIDTAFAGGPFSAEGTFAIPGIAITPAYSANVTASSAVLYCSAYTGGTPTTAYFDWGLTTSYGNTTAPLDLGSGIGAIPFRQLLSGLQPATYYHFRVVVSNAVTVVRGQDNMFYTDPALLIGDVNGDGRISGSEAGNVLSNYFFGSQAFLTSPATLGDGNFQFGLGEIPGWNFNVQVSSDLVTWTNLPTAAMPFYEFQDPQATNSPHRYYRLR